MVACAGIAIATLVSRSRPGFLPIVFAVVAIIISDIATRDRRAGTIAILHGAPRLRERFVWWKFGSALVLSLILCLAPIARVGLQGPVIFHLLIGIVFVAAAATSLGVMTSNSKTFIVGFLSFWYLVVNDHGATPWLDFAGFYGAASPQTMTLYLTLSILGLAAAEIFHRARLRRA